MYVLEDNNDGETNMHTVYEFFIELEPTGTFCKKVEKNTCYSHCS